MSAIWWEREDGIPDELNKDNIPPKEGFTSKFLNSIDYNDLTGDQRARILNIILETK